MSTDQTFVLHDGEDDDLTTALHAFLTLADQVEILHDWEGHDAGICLNINVRVGDEMVLHEDGSFTVRRRRQ